MSIDNYTELQAAVENWLGRSDLSARVPEFIELGEARIKREVRTREMLNRDTLTIDEDDRYVDLPADFLDHKSLRILIPNVVSGRRYFPDFTEVSIHELSQRSVNDARTPRFYSIHEQIELDSEADQAYTAEIFYYVVIPALSVTATNSLLTRAPDIYLYSALSEAAPFLINDERVATWEFKYTQARDLLNKQQLASRRGSPQISRVAGPTP